MRKITTFLLTMLLLPLMAFGQKDKMHVADFRLDRHDLTANSYGTIVNDQNGDKCALIKIQTTEKGFTFDNGSLGIAKTDFDHTAEAWVYIPYSSKRLKISHPQLGSITYTFPIPIEKACTYIMKLTTDRVVTNVFDYNHKGRLILHIDPKDVEVSLNGNVEQVTDGVLDKSVAFGTHQYLITAKRYHQLEDTVIVNSESEPKVKYIKLKQNWGWLQFSNYMELQGARLYVDNKQVGTINSMPFDINSGKHAIRIAHPLYQTYEQEVTIKDSTTTYLSPSLVANFGMLTLKVPDRNASIYIDDVLVGMGSYTDSVGAGQHVVECRRDKYRPTTKTIRVVTGENTTYELEPPTPIYSSVRIRTDNYLPVRVRIDDGRNSDENSEFSDDKVLIGHHTVYVTKKGYRSQQFDIDLQEGEPYERTISMEKVVEVNFRSHPDVVSLYVDGTYLGKTPLTYVISAGKHHIKMELEKYSSYEGDNTFDKDGDTFSKRLLRIYYGKTETYIEGGAQAVSLNAWYGAIGFYVHGFNLEGFYAGGFQKSDAISFNPVSSNYEYFTAKMKPKAFFGGKVGFGIKFGGRLRITPQIGAGVLQVAVDKNSIENVSSSSSYYSNSSINGYTDDELDEATYNVSVVGDIKFQLALVKGVSIVVTPSYSFSVNKNKLYEKLADVSDDIKGWGDGFNISAGLNFYF